MVKSTQALAAVSAEESSVDHANDAFRKTALSSLDACLKDLDPVLKGVTQGGKLDEANRIEAARKLISAEIDQLTNDQRKAEADIVLPDPPRTARAAEVIEHRAAMIRRAADVRYAATLAAKRKCVQELQAAFKAGTAGGDIDEANRIAAARKQLEAEIAKQAAAPHQVHMFDAELSAFAVDSFILYINGELICQGEGSRIVQQHIKIGLGDVITVRARKGPKRYGFACLINLPAWKKSIVTDTRTWKVYTPRNFTAWYDPAGVTDLRVPDQGYAAEALAHFDKGFPGDQQVLWTVGKDETVHLVLKVADNALHEMKTSARGKK